MDQLKPDVTDGREPRRLLKALFKTLLIVAVGAGTIAAAAATTPTRSRDAFERGSVGISTMPAEKAITFRRMAPGDSVTSAIGVRNVGSRDLRYAVMIFATNPDDRALSSQLALTIKAHVSECTPSGFDVDGTSLYGPDRLGTVDGLVAWGDSSRRSGAAARALPSGGADVLCLRVTLPSSAGDAVQGARTTATIRFDAQPVTA
jgi:hypothetical protein